MSIVRDSSNNECGSLPNGTTSRTGNPLTDFLGKLRAFASSFPDKGVVGVTRVGYISHSYSKDVFKPNTGCCKFWTLLRIIFASSVCISPSQKLTAALVKYDSSP